MHFNRKIKDREPVKNECALKEFVLVSMCDFMIDVQCWL